MISAADQANWLHQVLIQLYEAQLDVLGVSIGGWTATNLAVHDSSKIRSIMLLDPVFVFGPISAAAIFRSIPASVRWFPRSWRDNFNSWTANGAAVEDVPAADMIEAGMQSYALKLPTPQQITEQQLNKLRLAGADHPCWKIAHARLASRRCSWPAHTSGRPGDHVPGRVARDQRRKSGADCARHRRVPFGL
jgi:pimeloyl-ACP methyl ester carboxylesterase